MSRRLLLAAIVVTSVLAAAAPAPAAAQDGTVVVDTTLDPTYPTTERNATLTVGIANPDDGSGRYQVQSVRVYNDSGRTDLVGERTGSSYVGEGERATRNVSVGFEETGQERLHVAVWLQRRGEEPFLVTRTITAQVHDIHPSMSLSGGSADPGDRTTFTVTVANSLDERISGLEIDLTAENASLADDHHVIAGLDPGSATTIEVDARQAEPGRQAVTAALSYATADGERRRVTRQLATSVDGGQSRLSLGLSAGNVGPSDRTQFDVTVANGFSEPVSGIELRVRASNATFTERRRVASRLPASDAASFSFPATAVEPGQQTVTASLTFTTAGGDRQQITRDLTTSVERVRHPGNVTLTGLRLTRENDTLRIRGSTSNLGTTNVSGTLVEVAEGSRTGPADAQHRYFVGGIPASDYASFEVRAELDGPTNESATVPLRVSYVVDDTRITRTVEATYEPRPTDDSNSGGGSSTPLLLGGVLLVGVVGVGYWRWSG